ATGPRGRPVAASGWWGVEAVLVCPLAGFLAGRCRGGVILAKGFFLEALLLVGGGLLCLAACLLVQ
ncbi:hypothetical protein ACOTED_05090, partial [Achromobacter xylosoxidans]